MSASARGAALRLIRLYRRRVSPYKRFGCACRVHEGRASCSVFGERAIRRWGVVRGSAVLRARLAYCGEVYERAHRGSASRRRRVGERGDCDPGCDGCDLPGGSGRGSGGKGSGPSCNVLDCSDCVDCDCKRETRDLVAGIGTWVLAALVIVLTLAAIVIAWAGCGTGVCADDAAHALRMRLWWAAAGVSGVFGAVVLVLRVRRDLPVLGTIAWLVLLGLLAGGVQAGLDRWVRLLVE
jgi:putative component of membrane protein insertase Oxa1/YidC/SpoIIIJ protein YidD